ncbi:amastin-like protein [Leishmania tarentolae]|uniref:Amastin-like protein n=1 Tax=Leishmania tarentolae TaxID=5689 RepID=A0A640KLC6_LEITA|nr:amastin-like protein [Leishmania tarentolae]
MSQAVRAKKMFDDISSFSEEDVADDKAMQQTTKSPSETRLAQHVDPAVPSLAAFSSTAAPCVDIDDENPNAFAPKSASSFQQPTGPEGTGEEGVENVTMVARVSVSLTSKPSPRGASPAAPPVQTQELVQYPSAATHTQQQSESSASSAPAALSQQQSSSEEVEAAASPQQADASNASLQKSSRRPCSPREQSSGVEDHIRGTVSSGAEGDPPVQYPQLEKAEGRAFGSSEKREVVNSARFSPANFDDDEVCEQYTPPSNSRAAAAQREHSGKDYAAYGGTDPGPRQVSHRKDSKSEDFPFAVYIFPRLNPALVGHEGACTTGAAMKEGEEMPANVVERCCAYLMMADIRVSVYFVLLFASLVLVVLSICTSQLDIVGAACFTYWGYKDNCDNTTYSIIRPFYPTASIRGHLGVGAAFSVITLIVYLVNFVFAVIVVCCLSTAPYTISFNSRIILGVLGCVGVITQLISWAVVARIYNAGYYTAGELTYGAGFGFNLSSWVLNLLGVVLLFAIPSHLVKQHHQHSRRQEIA